MTSVIPGEKQEKLPMFFFGDMTSLISMHHQQAMKALPVSSRITEIRCYHTATDAKHQPLQD